MSDGREHGLRVPGDRAQGAARSHWVLLQGDVGRSPRGIPGAVVAGHRLVSNNTAPNRFVRDRHLT